MKIGKTVKNTLKAHSSDLDEELFWEVLLTKVTDDVWNPVHEEVYVKMFTRWR